MNPVLYEITKSAIGRISTAGGGVTAVGTEGGPIVWGLSTSQWVGLIVFVAGILQGAFDKITPRQLGVPEPAPANSGVAGGVPAQPASTFPGEPCGCPACSTFVAANARDATADAERAGKLFSASASIDRQPRVR